MCLPNGLNRIAISWGHREHLTLTETERRRRGEEDELAVCLQRFNVSAEASLLPQRTGSKVLNSEPSGVVACW